MISCRVVRVTLIVTATVGLIFTGALLDVSGSWAAESAPADTSGLVAAPADTSGLVAAPADTSGLVAAPGDTELVGVVPDEAGGDSPASAPPDSAPGVLFDSSSDTSDFISVEVPAFIRSSLDQTDSADVTPPRAAMGDTTARADKSAVPTPTPGGPATFGGVSPATGDFVRPWSPAGGTAPWVTRAMRRGPPVGSPVSGHFTRTLIVDSEWKTVRIETRSGEHVAFTSYAAPLADFQRATGEQERDALWKQIVGRDLGQAGAGADRGLLDIDIPMPLPGPFVRAIGPGANLKVRGSERITFGGQTSYTVEALDLESGSPSRWPQLDMEQQLTVNLEGTIGRKIHVYVDHRSGGDAFGAGQANQIRVHYDGDEDEIIQKVELGEVNLSLPGTEFVSYSGNAQGLFGAKMSAKLGKLDVVSITSKEEGKSSGASFTGTSESDSLVIKDISYKQRSFYAVDSDVLKYSNIGVQSVKVYVDDRNGANDLETGAQTGRAYLEDPTGGAAPASGPSQRGMFDELDELEDYLVDLQSGVIEFMSPVAASRVMAVSYVRSDGLIVGGADGDSLRLKLLKKEDRVAGTDWEPTRLHELKNVYDLGAEDIPEDGFELTIRKRSPSGEITDTQDGVPYIQILGLDTQGLGGDPIPDGIVDLEWIDFEKGYLIFPHFTPFCPEYDETDFYYDPAFPPSPVYTADELDPKNCLVYSKEAFDAGDDVYYLEVKYNRPRTTFYMGQINIIENSEVVRLNGARLTKGVDYTIYYPAGQLTLLTDEAKEPDAKITVDYDYKPFGIGGEKTLLGARAVYNWSDNVKLGTTWMYQSKGTPEDRPRLGEEPSRTVVGDLNLSADYRPELMTRIADAVPFVDTDAESYLKVAAEAAVSIPDPNTKGFVSIDDMEGTENVSTLGVSRLLWTPSSVPIEPMGVSAADRMAIDWYNPDRKVREGDLHPDLPSEEANDLHTVLELDYDALGASSWAGLTRLLSKTGTDYSDYQFVELWVNDDGNRQGVVHVDMGTISEDSYPLLDPNGELDSEDTDRNGFDADEDTGLDTVAGTDGAGVPGDDGDDDYEYSYGSDDYTRINGTENNERLDTEDLNGNWYLDTVNKYWQMSFDLSDTTYLIQDNSEIVSGNNWRLYRIPLNEASSVNGMVDWTVVKSARVWVENLVIGGEPLMIGSVDVVGSQWEPDAIRYPDGTAVPDEDIGDQTLSVGSKNTKEDIDYEPPFDPGVDEDTNLPNREQSLFLLYENLEAGNSAAARKIFYSDEDYTRYQALQFYVHGEEGVEEGTAFFLRLGADTLNYYEYALDIQEGWLQSKDGGRNRLTIPFSSLTGLKLEAFAEQDTAIVWGDTTSISGERFTRVGWPSLSRVRRLTIGVRNENEEGSGNDITGEVWVDDIRLTDVRKDIGWAERATVDARFADLLDLTFDLRHVDGEFRTLKQTTGSGQDNLSYNLKTTLNADRFVSGLGVSAPVSTTWKRSVTRPKFSTGSDIVLNGDQSEDEKTETVDRSVAVSLSRKRQSPDFWTHLLVDGLSLRASAADHRKNSPTKSDSSQTLRGRVAYRYAPQKAGVRVFRNTQLFFKPTSIRFSADTHLIHTQSYDVAADGTETKRTDNYDKKLNANGNIDFQFLDNLKTSHSVEVQRDLAQINRRWASLNAGVETKRSFGNNLSFNPKFGKWLSPQYSFSSTFTDNHGPEVRRAGDPFGIRNVRAQSSHQVRASFDFKKLLSEQGGGARRRQPQGDEVDGENGRGFMVLIDPVVAFVRKMDAVEGKYSYKFGSRYDRITWSELPGWKYQMGFDPGVDSDDRTEERRLDFNSGIKITNQIRLKGSYDRTMNGRWYRNAVSDTTDLVSQSESMNEVRKGSLSWSGLDKIGPLEGVMKSLRARSAVEYKKSYSGPAGAPSSRGSSFGMSPLVSLDATLKNGLTASFSWDRKRSLGYTLSGAGSVTEDRTGGTSLSLNYRFSAPQGLKLPFFGQKLRFQSNLDCSLTFRNSYKESRTAPSENVVSDVDPTASTKDFSVVGDATYSFSRNVSGGLQVSFAQSRDEKRDQTRRTIGVHLTAEFKF